MGYFDDEIKRYNIYFILMSREAYPYLKGFMDESIGDPIWCNGWNVYCQPWNSGTQNIIQHIDPPIRGIEKFRIYRQEDLQRFLENHGNFSYIYILDKFYEFYKYTIGVKPPGSAVDVINILWLRFVMEGVFNRVWDQVNKKWILKK